jgi:hypothetical protein
MTFDTYAEYLAYIETLPTDAAAVAISELGHSIRCLQIEQWDLEFSLVLEAAE